MKLLHVPFCFYPDAVGGTEIYVAGLAREQQRLGHQITICSPALSDAAYVHEGLPVRRFAINPNVNNIADLYDAGDIDAAHRFGKILDAEQPDVVHLHAFTRGVSLRLVHEAKVRGIATVFSYHTPTVSCMRGTLLRNGTDVCDGLLNVRTCASCNLNNLGVPQPVSGWLASLPPNAGRAISQVAPAGMVTTALRMTELVNLRHSTFRALTQDVDRLIALCKWTRDLLALNNVPADKISLSRQGISLEPINTPLAINPHSELRIAFLGRLSPEKGLPILMKAFREIPFARVTLDVYGISQDLEKPSKPIAIHDSRIKFHAPLLRSELIGTLQTYDLIAVPSQWLETGPMVVMEAFAAGCSGDRFTPGRYRRIS